MPTCNAHPVMPDGPSSKIPWLVPIVVAVIGLVASPVWGPPLCRAINVCDEDGPATSSPPGQPVTFPPFSIPANVETNVFLSETSGPAGSTLKVSGEGFQAGETIVIMIHTFQVGQTTASAAGSFSGVEVTVPDQLGVFAPNQFTVTASGNASIRHASAPFTVSG